MDEGRQFCHSSTGPGFGTVDGMKRFFEAVRAAWLTQVEMQQRYLDRHELSGYETRAAARRLRWSGDRLVGCEMPSDA